MAPEVVEAHWRRVFASTDFSRTPFVATLPTIGFMAPQSSGLTLDQYRALVGALAECGESRFYATVVSHPDDDGVAYHWCCQLPEFEDFAELIRETGGGMYAIYGEGGGWAVAVDWDDYAAVAASGPAAAALARRYDFAEARRWLEVRFGGSIPMARSREDDGEASPSWTD
ncbi:MAG: hypothetical protein AB7V42_12040 [Thermoleophilia bacterium]